jgi:hypothetical protein
MISSAEKETSRASMVLVGVRSAVAVLSGILTLFVIVFGTVLAFFPEMTQPGGFPTSTLGLAGLVALEIVGGTVAVLVAVLLVSRSPRAHGIFVGAVVFVLNTLSVAEPNSPWPLIPGLIVIAFVPLQSWAAISIARRIRGEA